jgi:hypothetical protein
MKRTGFIFDFAPKIPWTACGDVESLFAKHRKNICTKMEDSSSLQLAKRALSSSAASD